MGEYFPLLGNKVLKRMQMHGTGREQVSPHERTMSFRGVGESGCRHTLALLIGAPICSSCGRSLELSSFRYHHCISKDMGAELTALKAHGISTSSPSPTLTSLGTSVNAALVWSHGEEYSNRQTTQGKLIKWENGALYFAETWECTLLWLSI